MAVKQHPFLVVGAIALAITAGTGWAQTTTRRVATVPATFTASPWAYNGHVFVMSEEGDTYVIEAAADQYKLERTNSLDDFSMASPAIVGDRLLIRTQHRLYSIRNKRTSGVVSQ